MSNLLRIALGLALSLVLLVAVSFYLPSTINIARDIEIEASEPEIYPHIANLRNFNLWSPWASIDPGAAFSFSGPEEGPGATMTWKSANPDMGNGSMTITDVSNPKSVNIALNFGEIGQGKTQFSLSPTRRGTRVKWQFQADTGHSPLDRWSGVLLDMVLGEKYDEGLQKLKARVEQQR